MTEFFPERFEVDTLGMRQLHQDRRPEQLVKELVQNAFDEEAKRCRITAVVEDTGVKVVVEDDGPGFRDIRDAYTLMGDTPKRLDPERRGRFNMGEKEFLSVALWATIETRGTTVEFPESGGRLVKRNRRRGGTKVTAMMPWGGDEAQRLILRMKMIRPPIETDYRVNGERVERVEELKVHSATLDTVIQESPGSPMRRTRRRADMHILPAGKGTAWIYEMGIPIQEIESEYSVDVMQKVPMPPNRDTVPESYLKRIYTEILNAMHEKMEKEQFSENWTRIGVENPAIQVEAVKSVVHNRYGEKVVTWSSNTDSNMRATDAGYQVLHPNSLGKSELENMRKLAGLKTAHEVFGKEGVEERTIEPVNPVREAFATWVVKLGRMAGKTVTPVFIRERSNTIACCTMSTDNPEMSFNTFHLDGEFFTGRGKKQLEIIIHELGHAEMEGNMSHGPRWGEACSRMGAMIAVGLAEEARQE